MITDPQPTIVEQSTLSGIIEFVWQTLLHEELTVSEPQRISEAICATISIGGPWTATLEVTMPPSLARRFAQDLLGLDGELLEDEDIDDAIGELANVVGGNVKGLIDDGAASTLSLPVVSHATASVTGGQLTAVCGFTVSGEPMTWALFERA